mmetsp:Transcript_2227/g.6882  ORF Transcript_2227/g.6882 Transcript_2227/m.6882 type:complete len:245 (-) Transcript_2227:837-1571(-)
MTLSLSLSRYSCRSGSRLDGVCLLGLQGPGRFLQVPGAQRAPRLEAGRRGAVLVRENQEGLRGRLPRVLGGALRPDVLPQQGSVPVFGAEGPGEATGLEWNVVGVEGAATATEIGTGGEAEEEEAVGETGKGTGIGAGGGATKTAGGRMVETAAAVGAPRRPAAGGVGLAPRTGAAGARRRPTVGIGAGGRGQRAWRGRGGSTRRGRGGCSVRGRRAAGTARRAVDPRRRPRPPRRRGRTRSRP